MAPFFSRAFGLTLTCNETIPGLIPAAAGHADVRIQIGEFPAGADPADHAGPEVWSDGGDPDHEADAVAVRVAEHGASLLLAYGDGMRFLVRRSGDEIWSTGPGGVSLESIATYLLGPVFGLVLRLRGLTCLHASVVAVSHGPAAGAMAFVGAAGAGKSTVAAAFALRGHRVLSDDIAVLVPETGRWMVESAVPSIRLWDDSTTMLFGTPAALPLMAPGWDKRLLDLTSRADAFAAGARLPLTAVYVLHPREAPDGPAAAQRLSPRDAVMALVANTYANVLLDRQMRAVEFRALSSLVTTVPVWQIPGPTTAAELTALCERVGAGGPADGA